VCENCCFSHKQYAGAYKLHESKSLFVFCRLFGVLLSKMQGFISMDVKYREVAKKSQDCRKDTAEMGQAA
jgi:hypothetical protein